MGRQFAGCPQCRDEGKPAPLEVVYDYVNLARAMGSARFLSARSIWDLRDLLPLDDAAIPVTLGEGNTPLLDISDGSPIRLLLKNEAQNPTGAFKDRFNSVSISVARQLGYTKVVTMSTGNHGLSSAAFAAAAGLNCTVLLHEETSELFVSAIRAYGAEAIVCGDRAERFAQYVDEGCYPTYTMAPFPELANPYGVEGYKTISYEIYRQLGGNVPDNVFVPIGGGDAIYGVWKGFRELRELGVTAKTPRLFGCQAQGSNPVVRSFRRGLTDVEDIGDAASIALSIRESTAGMQALQAIYESGGEAVEATDEEILEGLRFAASKGLLPESASAVSVACCRRIMADRRIDGQSAVCILTSSSLKWPEFLRTLVSRD